MQSGGEPTSARAAEQPRRGVLAPGLIATNGEGEVTLTSEAVSEWEKQTATEGKEKDRKKRNGLLGRHKGPVCFFEAETFGLLRLSADH